MRRTLLALGFALVALAAPDISSAAVLFSDDFNDNVINTSLWGVMHQGGTTVAETNQRLEITFPTTAHGSQFTAGLQITQVISGDFDFQVDYQLLEWPVGNGVRVGICPTWWDAERTSFGKERPSPEELYAMNSYDGIVTCSVYN